MRKLVFYIFIFIFVDLSGQEFSTDHLVSLFDRQLKVFPQEKIYLHTDKPYYISGEEIWLRAHLVDASTHVPAFASQYVYVELINPLDSIMDRIKIRQVDSIYSGRIQLPDELPEGDYTLRAYTYFMQNLDEHYWFTQNVRIGDPQTRLIRTNTRFQFASDKLITAEFSFTHPTLLSAINPESVKVSINNGRQRSIKTGDNSASVTFNIPPDTRKRVMLLEIATAQYTYRQFITIPVPDDDFEVMFYPEGGTLLEETFSRVAFKALRSNGTSSEISGVVYDDTGKEITRITSEYSGMGMFGFHCEKEKTYYAICTNEKGETKQFDIPAASPEGCALSVNQRKENWHISILQPAGKALPGTLYLLAHTRGQVYCAYSLPNGKTTTIIPNAPFPSGVMQLLLLDSQLRPLSERLVFISNNDQARVDFTTDSDNYTSRSLVSAEVSITDKDHQSLTGNFSVSVTDDGEVKSDTCNNILVSLLLTSDLKGYIENPAAYFENSATSAKRLDLLMMTQGWRRYDIPTLTSGTLSHPEIALERGAQISGTVKSALNGKAVAGKQVTIFSTNQKYLDKVITDQNGNFYFNCDLPDSTHFVVHADPKRGIRCIELDPEVYPGRTVQAVVQEAVDRTLFTRYADKTEQKFTYENGMRMIHLEGVTVTAKQKPKHTSIYYGDPDHSISTEVLEIAHPNTMDDIYALLRLVPGVNMVNGRVEIRGGISFLMKKPSPLIFIDDFPGSLEEIIPQNIAQIDVLTNASIFGIHGSGGAIMFYTKDPLDRPTKEQPHVKMTTPLGYQKPTEFYSPKYDKPEARESKVPDLRTTIHWQPAVQLDQTGKAFFNFYTADSETTYTVVIEGVTNEGKIIYKKEKISRNTR